MAIIAAHAAPTRRSYSAAPTGPVAAYAAPTAPLLRGADRLGRAIVGATSVATALLLTACGGAGSPQAPATTAREDTPVVLYLIDTLRADRLGLYGYAKPTSPVIDALAKESVVFDAAYAPAPWTLPSVASIVTSRWPCEHGLVKTGLALSPALPTLAERLQALGYATGAYYQNVFPGDVAGLDRGYQLSEYRNAPGSLDEDTWDFLRRTGDAPFLLYLHSTEPHTTWLVPQEMIRPFGHVGIDEREAFRAHWTGYKTFWFTDYARRQPIGSTDTTEGIDYAIGNLRAMRPGVETLYDASVRWADTELGEAIGALKASGTWDRTLFIVLADHGEEMDEHGLWFHDQSVYEELTHVPLLIRFPEGRFGGRRVAERVSLLDVVPTVLDHLGRGGPCEGCSGSSLMPLVDPARGGSYASDATPSVRMNEIGYYRPLKEAKGDVNVVVRDGAVKGIWNKEPGRVELYDLAADPGEQRDLAATDEARAAALGEQAAAWLTRCEAGRVPPVELPPGAIDDQDRERMRAHGYFGG